MYDIFENKGGEFMKKFSKIFLMFFLVNLIFLFTINVYANDETLEIESNNAILIDYETGKILYGKNIDEKIYPASTTKIMTAILVIENCDLNDLVTISESAINSVEYGYVTGNLKAGESFTVDQMLHVLLVASANDAACALAEHVSGSTESFVQLMNDKAIDLGCKNTHFVNPNGIQNENHYSTAYDLSLIAKYAMANSTFRNLVTFTSYKLPTTELYSIDNRFFSTTNEMIMPYNNYYYQYANGIKTGYTSMAGYCLVGSAKKNDFMLISVVVGSPTNAIKYSDTKSLFEYGYDNFEIKQIASKNSAVQTISVKHGTNNTKTINALLEDNIYAVVGKTSTDVFYPEITLNSNLKAPISQGDIIGIATYNINGITITSNLLASSNVKKSYLFLYLLAIVILFFITYTILKKLFNKKKKNYRIKK